MQAISLNKYPCVLCPGTIPIVAHLLKSVYLPDQQIEVFVQFNELQSKIKSLKISLWLELQINSLLSKRVVAVKS